MTLAVVPPTDDQLNAEAAQAVDLLDKLLGAADLSPTLRAIAKPMAVKAVKGMLAAPDAQSRVNALRKVVEAWRAVRDLLAD